MNQYLTSGTVAGVLGFSAVLAGVFGKPALQAFLADPNTAATVLQVAGGLAAIIAGGLKGVGATK
ncbi:hypothetical protein DFR50_107120 [Roseiarcus fermentans]|uniref:Uncharacterized protein n=1 Tax=Roseiarcus fermentans TaxID=1473586 RepID=A0A366FP62_9HYPH|nr:hypothetical protein [Roseiarcus fermentans]RBP15850.1 hypothetical protein DFR50_107120 [Roseiarcus fermentans]